MATGGLRTTTITVQFVNPPKGDAKTGSIKSGDTYYRVGPELLDVFSANGTYEIDYKVAEVGGKGSGNFMNFVESARSAEGEPLTPQRRQVPTSVSTQKAVARQNGTGANLELSTIGILKSFIENGKVDLTVSSISAAHRICKNALLDEMNDEIPY